MAEKEFVVTHARARAPITVRGKSLKEALEKEGLDPNIWKPITSKKPEEGPPGDEPDSEPVPD